MGQCWTGAVFYRRRGSQACRKNLATVMIPSEVDARNRDLPLQPEVVARLWRVRVDLRQGGVWRHTVRVISHRATGVTALAGVALDSPLRWKNPCVMVVL